MSAPALRFRGVSLRHGPGQPAILEGLDLELAPGERVALVGLNGSGKTSLLLAAVGLVPHTGEILVGERLLDARSAPRIRAEVGFLFNVPEDQLIFPRVLDDVAFGPRRRGLPAGEAEARARAELAALGADALAERPIHELSHGQKLRVALAGALVTRPPLLLLDEPSAGLDPPGMLSLARLLRAQPAAMLVATHDLAFAARLCPRYLLLEGGRLAEAGRELECLRARWERELA